MSFHYATEYYIQKLQVLLSFDSVHESNIP